MFFTSPTARFDRYQVPGLFLIRVTKTFLKNVSLRIFRLFSLPLRRPLSQRCDRDLTLTYVTWSLLTTTHDVPGQSSRMERHPACNRCHTLSLHGETSPAPRAHLMTQNPQCLSNHAKLGMTSELLARDHCLLSGVTMHFYHRHGQESLPSHPPSLR